AFTIQVTGTGTCAARLSMNHQTRAMRSDHYRRHEMAHIRGVCPSLASLGCSRAQHQTDLDHGERQRGREGTE
ncbi:hypothetical protein CH063_06204, partial [Colletotrichum higginsianum]